jgi:hypothetical protein
MHMIARRQLRAPQQDGSVFVDPPLNEFRLTLTNGAWEQVLPDDLQLCGRSFRELRRLGRETAKQAARTYLAASGEPIPSLDAAHIIAAGHQPEIIHPGVWIKNFVLNGLAAEAGLVPLNLIVDNDAVKSTALVLPRWRVASEPDSYWIDKINFDTWHVETPYEECTVQNEHDFASFPQRVGEATQSWGFTPLVNEFWAAVGRHSVRTTLLGERIVGGRRALERRWGCNNLELPVSRLCETEVFAWFAAHLFDRFERFHELYNKIVQEYRRVNGLRSRNHPVPNLAKHDDWLEVPLWAWRTGAHRRGRLFVRTHTDSFELRVEGDIWPQLPRARDAFVETWRQLHRDGFKIRSRALTTTLFARLFIADAFIHGIGGGKYDELTDDLIRQFYGIKAPPVLVVSATLLLPFQRFAATLPWRRAVQQQLRDLWWNPQRHLTPPPDLHAAKVIDRKRALLAELSSNGSVGLSGHRELQRLNEVLRPFVKPATTQARLQAREIDAELHANTVLGRRDFAFCLQPEDRLRPFCQKFLAQPAGMACDSRLE